MSEPRPRFNATLILEAFNRLADELERRGVVAEIYVVGGNALALAYEARRITRDVDAVFEPKATVREAASTVAIEMGLPEDWLNDGARAFFPGPDPASTVVIRRPGLTVSVASPRQLLAMKLLASRADQDVDDIKLLYGLCGMRTAADGLALLEAVYPNRPVPARTRFLLEELFGHLLPHSLEQPRPS
ncbi:conserved hypothetical protein [Acidimicrobium ferrooxidans DSM 10331]|uniref:DUF6036 domain-containing protein n=1 Tax=Acidimicrobium ferrooxidans (strain DSM 10331 / JCM 15462 / NBRC 103882 / ICP) TaxID=525909 RepID=C7M1H9_ACIFD|nr:DUF6036 family nucleotidyltransferase [Acidimicrobium ferrooxidans]ACU53028.1 conserved hypothetical protein [Acidimicrobium ferrooxidans DSM 10331]